MDTFQFQIEVHGELPGEAREVAPHTLSVSALLELLAPLEAALAATAPDVDLGGWPALVFRGEFATASAGLVVHAPEPLLPAAATLTAALATGDWRQVPAAAQEKLHGLSKAVVSRAWRLRVLPNGCPSLQTAEVSAEHPVPAPTPSAEMHELTSVYGTLVAVGGADATKFGRLRLLDSRVISLELSEPLAKELATRLFEEVCLEGVATWDTVTMRTTRFAVHRATDYRRTDPATAFDRLREEVDDAFDGVDPLDYQRRLRHGGAA